MVSLRDGNVVTVVPGITVEVGTCSTTNANPSHLKNINYCKMLKGSLYFYLLDCDWKLIGFTFKSSLISVVRCLLLTIVCTPLIPVPY